MRIPPMDSASTHKEYSTDHNRWKENESIKTLIGNPSNMHWFVR